MQWDDALQGNKTGSVVGTATRGCITDETCGTPQEYSKLGFQQLHHTMGGLYYYAL